MTDLIDALLGLCSHTWYRCGDMVDGGCPDNDGASHLCGCEADHAGGHVCQDCDETDPPLLDEVPC